MIGGMLACEEDGHLRPHFRQALKEIKAVDIGHWYADDSYIILVLRDPSDGPAPAVGFLYHRALEGFGQYLSQSSHPQRLVVGDDHTQHESAFNNIIAVWQQNISSFLDLLPFDQRCSWQGLANIGLAGTPKERHQPPLIGDTGFYKLRVTPVITARLSCW